MEDRLEDQPKRIQALGRCILVCYIDCYNWRLVSCLAWTMSEVLLKQGGLAGSSAYKDVQVLWQGLVGVQSASAFAGQCKKMSDGWLDPPVLMWVEYDRRLQKLIC